MDVLINLSGGIDSVFCLYDYLTNHKDRILVHHCVLNNQNKEPSDRAIQELKAVKNVLKWFDDHNLKHYYYIESRFDHPVGIAILEDIEIIGFLTGIIVRNNAITKCIMPTNKKDLEVRVNEVSDRRFKLIEFVSGKKLEFLHPIAHYTKKQLISKLPSDLLINCWSCRKSINGLACGTCYACKDRT